MEANNKAWARFTLSGVEYYGRITIVPVTDDIPLIERVKDVVFGNAKVILEYPHILTRIQGPDGRIHMNPIPLYPAETEMSFKSMIIDAGKIDTVVPMKETEGIIKAIRDAEGIGEKIIAVTPVAPIPKNVIQFDGR